jgi:hypothetical protein
VKKNRLCFAALVLLVMAATLMAHPHIRKSVTAALPGDVEAVVTYVTVPSNETHTTNAAAGSFLVPGGCRVKLSADLKAGNLTLPAGEHTIGVIKNSAGDWTMAVYPGRLGRGETPDKSKLIKLDSLYHKSSEKAAHMSVDISPGWGKFEGKVVLVVHFGSMSLAGAIS